MSEFTLKHYRHCIVRIWGQGDTPIGAGFLVSPGYVITCAHVVLGAIGVKEEDYASHLNPPEAKIKLDFPILACNQEIFATVIAWRPYNLDTGDIALLHLLQPEPSQVKTIPFTQLSSISSSDLSVYGFGENNSGGQTDAYRIKTEVAGPRWMLCKNGDEKDETIQPGYSGAPVWISDDKSLLGMVAAVKVAKSRAYVIPAFRLQEVLQKLDQLKLQALIQENITAQNPQTSTLFKQAIDAALRICNPNAKNVSWGDQIDQLSQDRADPKGWEQEGALIRFAIALAWQDKTTEPIENQLKEWVNSQGHHFSDLYVRFDREMKKIHVQQDNNCEHVMVVLELEEKQTDHFRVSMWPIGNHENYQASLPPQPIVFQEVISQEALPKFLREKLRKNIGAVFPTIHLFMPCASFCDSIEMQPTRSRRTLGSEYPLIYRPQLQSYQSNKAFTDTRATKWESLIQKEKQVSSQVFQVINVDSDNPDDWVDDLEYIEAAILQDYESVSEIFNEIHQEFSLPVALWVRDKEFQDQIQNILTEQFSQFPYTVQKSRESAVNSQTKDEDTPIKKELGHHIALVWDDPSLLPPIMQF